MARQEHDREDLLAEATALVQRCELRVRGCDELVFVGFRGDGCGSVYFGPDEAYHFNTAGELRRAHRDGLLFKADRGRLVSLRRERTEGQVALLRHDLDDGETAALLESMRLRLGALNAALVAGEFHLERSVGDAAALLDRIHRWLPTVLSAAVAQRPNAG